MLISAGSVAALATMAMGCEAVLGLNDVGARPSDAGSTPDPGPKSDDGGTDAATDAWTDESLRNEPAYVVAGLGKHTCAVGPDKRAHCWGDNSEGQLGDGTTEPRDRPVWVAPFDDVVDVSAGYTHSCLVRANGDLYCWGKNDRGQLGDGTKNDRRDTSVLTMTGALKVGVAGWHTCAITQLRGVRCWGDNYYGALGDGSFTASARYVDVKGLSDVKALAVGVMHNCAATDQGRVYCWGRSVFGALGYMVDGDAGSPDPNDPGSHTATLVPGLNDVVEVAAGEDHTCATRVNGQLVCWGRGDYGELGDGKKGDRTAPAPIGGNVTYAVHLGAGAFDTCATFSGRVRCWGQNNFGQLGNGNTNPGDGLPSPAIVWLSDIVRVSTGEHACAWRIDGKLFCWGRNDVGQLGLGRVSTYELQPQEVTFPPAADGGR